ncbi:hypothetical protein ACFX1X_026770 [Malus domestica]
MIVLVQLFSLIMNIHFSFGVDLDTLFEALEQLFEPQLIDPNIFNPMEPKISASVANSVSRPLQRQGITVVARRASATGYQRVPDSGASSCRQVSAYVTLAGATRSSVVGSLWMIRSAILRRDPLQVRRTPSLLLFGRPERQGHRHFQ